jgi:hypothetical protein
MSDHSHRTFVGTLVFLDVLTPTPAALEGLREAGSRSVGHLDGGDCLRVGHPSGEVLIFPGDPEDALFVALALRDALEHEAATQPGFGARMGVHLGPVRLVEGSAQGEGATVVTQLASIAAPGQILTSRSFFEVVSSMSVDHRALLRALGRRRTHDGRELDVYELGGTPQVQPETTWPAGRTPAAGTPAVHPIPLVMPVEAPAPAAPAQAWVTGGWATGALEELTAVLAKAIGPLASTLVRRASRKTEDPRALIAELAEAIDNDTDRHRFEDFGRAWVRRSRAVGAPGGTPHPPATPGGGHGPMTPRTPPGVPATPGRSRLAGPPGYPIPAGGTASLTPQQRAALEAALAPHLGPIARVMVERVAREANDWGSACQTLSAAIPDHISREDFLRTLAGPSPAVGGRTQTKQAGRGKTFLGLGRAPKSKPRPSPSRQMAAESAPTPRTRALAEEDLRRAEQALAVALGPVARALVRRAAQKAATPQELFASLAAEVPEGPERERFLASQPEF